MITKHSADDANVKPLQVGLRLARVVSIGNGTVDVCPVGSSVVLHDIPVTSATTMSVGDVINLQVIDNKRFAFASQNAVSINESSTSNVTIQNGDVIISGEGGTGTGTITGVTAGNGLTGGGTSGSVSINAVAGDGIVVSADSIAVSADVVRTSRSITAGNGLTGGGDFSANRTLSVFPAATSAIAVDGPGIYLKTSFAGSGLSMTSQVLNINLASTSGLNTTSGLAVGQGNGISVLTNTIAVQRATTSGLTFSSGGLAVGQGNGISVDTSSIKAVALTNGGLSVAAGGISVVEGNGIVVSAGISAKANADKAVVVESTGIGVVANASLGITVSSSGVGINKKATASGLKFDASDETKLGLDLANPSGLSFSGNGLQLDNSVAGDGLKIGDKKISVFSALTSLSISEDSVDVNYAHGFPWTNNHTWSTNASIASAGAMSGFAGSGWLMRNFGSLGLMDIDELSVRGRLRVYELLIQQIRATNGSIFVSSSAKAASVTGSGPYTITIDAKDTDMCPFVEGDLLRAQRVDLGGLSSSSPDIVWQSNLRVDSVSGLSFIATLVSGNAPVAGMEYVRLGNDTVLGRRGTVYLTADDSFAPYIDVVSGVSSFEDWGTKIRARIGRLDGVTASITSSPGSDEFGIWAGTGTGVNNRYIRISDKIVELRNVPIELFGNIGSAPQVRLTAGGANGNIPSFAMGITLPESSTTGGDGVWMGQETAGGSYTFRVGVVATGALTDGILWNGSTLTVTGAINVVAGGNAETTSGAQAKASNAQTAAINASASDATSKSNTAQSNAQSYSDTELGKVVNKTTGKLAFSFAAAPTGTGLYLGSSHLGYYNGGWKTYMNSDGDFFLSGTGTQGLTWDRSSNTLTVDGAITAQSGNIAGVLTIGTSGGIYQGNGTFASPGTGLKMFSSGVNHVSSITVTATGGTFTITVVRTDTGASATTGSLAYNIAATGTTSMQTSLQALASVGSGNAAVTKTGNVYTITFSGARASTKMTVTVATGSLTGGTAVVTTVTEGGLFGQISGYSFGTEQWNADTDGTLKAGGGKVILSSSGISLLGSNFGSLLNYSGGIQFKNGDTNTAILALDTTDSNNLKIRLNLLSAGTFLVEAGAANGAAESNIVVRGGSPFIAWDATSGSTNSKVWDMGVSINKWFLRTQNDAGTLLSNILEVTRASGSNVVTSFVIKADATFFEGSISTSLTDIDLIKNTQIKINSPFLRFWSTDSAINNKRWDIGVTGSTFQMRLFNDANSGVPSVWFQAARSLNIVSSISITSTSTSFTGDVTIGSSGGGLNVNTSGAADGEIKATTGTFSGNISTSAGNITVATNKFVVTGSTGNTSIAGTLGVTGAINGSSATFTGLLAANAGINVDSNKFVVSGDSTGNVLTSGTFSVDGELKSSFSTTWINTSLAFNTNWSNFAADETTWSFARYKRVGDLVFLRGMIKRAVGTGLSTSPFTLPANFRPAKRQICVVMALRSAQTPAAIRADVLSTGVVQFSDIDATSAYDYISLNGIVFSVV